MTPSDLIAIAAVIVSLASVYLGRRTAGSYSDLQAEIGRLEQKITKLEAQIDAKTTIILELQTRIAEQESQIEAMKGRERRMLRGVQILVKQIKEAGLAPDWEPAEE